MSKVRAYNRRGVPVFTSVGRVIAPHSASIVDASEVNSLVDSGDVVSAPYVPIPVPATDVDAISPDQAVASITDTSVKSDNGEKSSTIAAKRASRKATKE
jgi:hypothetical protein